MGGATREGVNRMKKKSLVGWADVGSHGKIFEFIGGVVGDRYPHLLHIYSKKVTSDLKKVRITIEEIK